MALERVQKFISRVGITSRRKAEELITFGEVTINGKVAKLGDKVEPSKDSVKVSGKLVVFKGASLQYIAFYKPKLVISSWSDPQGRPDLQGYFGKIKDRIFPIGRLDFMSEGLLLLTNDGDWAEKVQKFPKLLRVYHVKIKGHMDSEKLKRLERGLKKEGRFFKPLSVHIKDEYAQKSLVEVAVLGSGTMDIKTYFEDKGFLVDRLIRVRVGQVKLGDLKPGQFRYLTGSQAQAVIEQPDLAQKILDDSKSGALLPTDLREEGQRMIKPLSSSRTRALVSDVKKKVTIQKKRPKIKKIS